MWRGISIWIVPDYREKVKERVRKVSLSSSLLEDCPHTNDIRRIFSCLQKDKENRKLPSSKCWRSSHRAEIEWRIGSCQDLIYSDLPICSSAVSFCLITMEVEQIQFFRRSPLEWNVILIGITPNGTRNERHLSVENFNEPSKFLSTPCINIPQLFQIIIQSAEGPESLSFQKNSVQITLGPT